MAVIRFFVPGTPQGKARPRSRIVTKAGKYTAQVYTPTATRLYEDKVRAYMIQQAGKVRLQAPITAYITAHYEVPKSYPKNRREACLAGTIPHTGKPDLDNLAKAILDALNGLAYQDDSQITELHITKAYAERPGVLVCLHGAEE